MPITRCNSAGFRLMLGLGLVIATGLLLSPGEPQAGQIPHLDKLAHLALFSGLAFLADAGWPDQGFVAAKYLPLFGYGLAIELLQIGIPTRSFELLDLAADGLALVLYGLAVLPLLRRLNIR